MNVVLHDLLYVRPGIAALLAIVLVTAAGAPSAWADDIGDDTPSHGSASRDDAAQLELGRQVFHRKCIKCHASGRNGAPVVGRPGEWATRLEQPLDVLIEHAIEGHEGRRGRMPPKGDFATLSDDDVVAAVHYIVARGRWLAEQLERRRVACVKDQTTQQCEPMDANDGALLRFFWLLREAREGR